MQLPIVAIIVMVAALAHAAPIYTDHAAVHLQKRANRRGIQSQHMRAEFDMDRGAGLAHLSLMDNDNVIDSFDTGMAIAH